MEHTEQGPGLSEAGNFLVNLIPHLTPLDILDVGANPLSPPPYDGLLKSGYCRIWGFEPNERAFLELEQTKGPMENYLPHAVGDGSEVTFHQTRPSGFSSTLSLSRRGFQYLGHWQGVFNAIKTSRVSTVKLDDMKDLPPPDLVKIDIQGGELAVFANGRQKMSQASAVIVEIRHTELYENEPMAGGIDNELRHQGFIFHKYLGNKRMALHSSQFERLNVGVNRNQWIDGDAAYILNLMEPDRIETPRLERFLLIAHEVLRSFDLVARCLDILVDRKVIPDDSPRRYVDCLPATHVRPGN